MTPTTPCALILQVPGGELVRPAAFLWRGRSGIVWVEPAYLDQYSTRPAAHVLRGEVRDIEDGLAVEPEEAGQVRSGEVIALESEREGVQLQLLEVQGQTDAMLAELEAQGRDYLTERAQLGRLLEDLLGEISG